MPLPDTFPELLNAGYVHKGGGHCSACKERIEWFITPNNRRMPFSRKKKMMVGQFSLYEVKAETLYEPHWASCPEAHRFRRERA